MKLKKYAEYRYAMGAIAVFGLLCLGLVQMAGAPSEWIPVFGVALTATGLAGFAVLTAIGWRQRRN